MWLAVDESAVAAAAGRAVEAADASARVDLTAVAAAVAVALPGSRSAPRAALLAEAWQHDVAALTVALTAHAQALATASRSYAEVEAWATSLTHDTSLHGVLTAGPAR